MFYVNVPVDISDFHVILIRLTFLANNLLFTLTSSRLGPTFALILSCLSFNLMNINQLFSPGCQITTLLLLSSICMPESLWNILYTWDGCGLVGLCTPHKLFIWLDLHVYVMLRMWHDVTLCNVLNITNVAFSHGYMTLSVLQNLTKVSSSKLEYSYFWLSYSQVKVLCARIPSRSVWSAEGREEYLDL